MSAYDILLMILAVLFFLFIFVASFWPIFRRLRIGAIIQRMFICSTKGHDFEPRGVRNSCSMKCRRCRFIEVIGDHHDFELRGVRKSCSMKCSRCGLIEVIGDHHDFDSWVDGTRQCRKCGYEETSKKWRREEVEGKCHKCGTKRQFYTHHRTYGSSHNFWGCPNCDGRWCKNCGRNQLYQSFENEWITGEYLTICDVCGTNMDK